MVGKTEDERVRVDVMAEQSMDFRNGLVRLCYNPAFVSPFAGRIHYFTPWDQSKKLFLFHDGTFWSFSGTKM